MSYSNDMAAMPRFAHLTAGFGTFTGVQGCAVSRIITQSYLRLSI